VILLDTSVLVYAVGIEHPLRDPCRRVLAAQRAGAIDAAVTVEIIQEFTHARTRRHRRADAVAVARDYAASLRVLQATAADLDRGLDIFVAHPDLGMFDSIVAAVALNHGATALISTDGGFGSISGLRWVNPATPDLDTIVAPVGAEAMDLAVDIRQPHRRNE
jgi:predicted nucleic acid-binding protein